MSISKSDYYQSLPAKRMGAGVLFLNDQQEVLLVQPTYKDHWEIPGGVVELNESPRAAAMREVKEELGLDLNEESLRLICVEYLAAGEEITEALMFVFLGGTLSAEQVSKISLDSAELASFTFVGLVQLRELLNQVLSARVEKCLSDSQNIYSESRY